MIKALKRFIIIVAVVTIFMEFSITVSAASNTSLMNSMMLDKINDLRASYNLPALIVDSELVSYAQIRAEEITGKFSHTRPDGTDGLDIIPLSRSSAGENLSLCDIDMGIEAAISGTYTTLVNSPTHLNNMISSEYTKIGIASVEVNGKIYVAYMFSN